MLEKRFMEKQKVVILRKTVSRLISVQVVYQLYLLGIDSNVESIIENTLHCYKEKMIECALEQSNVKLKFSEKFVKQIVDMFIWHQDSINKLIDVLLEDQCSYMPNLEVMSVIRVGVCEQKFFFTPYQIIANEYTNLAASLVHESKVAVVNAVLNNSHSYTL